MPSEPHTLSCSRGIGHWSPHARAGGRNQSIHSCNGSQTLLPDPLKQLKVRTSRLCPQFLLMEFILKNLFLNTKKKTFLSSVFLKFFVCVCVCVYVEVFFPSCTSFLMSTILVHSRHGPSPFRVMQGFTHSLAEWSPHRLL